MLRILFLLVLLSPLPLMANQLANHPSPYLALHADDPVDWRVWSEETIAQAAQKNKLLFVSVGYFACHWCHVMQRESFSDPKIAARLNQYFQSVKVDRELNPVLDERLMDFLQATTGRGGWPMNIILTPEGYPLVGFTYLPAERFDAVLVQMIEKWSQDKPELVAAAKEVNDIISTQLNHAESIQADATIHSLARAFLDNTMEYADVMGGGFGHVTKFPSAPQLLAMLKINSTIKNTAVDDFLKTTLDKMRYSGLYDEIASGFFRYTVDPDWQTPHFEKMLYTNTQLAELYLLAGTVYQHEAYIRLAMKILVFLTEEMAAENGALITSLSAIDDKNIEGGYYLWQDRELKQLLGEKEAKLVSRHWGMNQPEQFEAGNLPVQGQPLTDKDLLDRLAKSRVKLHNHRKTTRKIPRDHKQLASLNGYALAVFADVAHRDRRYREAGNKLAVYLKKLWKKPRLAKALDQTGHSLGQGTLGDYAAVALGLLKWSKVVKDKQSGAIGREILFTAWDKFYSESGWQPLETSLLPNPPYRMHLQDSSEPSAETMLLRASHIQLSIESDAALQKLLQENLSRVTQGMLDEPFYYASLFGLASELKANGDQSK